MTATTGERRVVRATEQAIDSQILLQQITQMDEAQDVRLNRVAQILGEAQQQLATVSELNALEDAARLRLASTLRSLAGALDGVSS